MRTLALVVLVSALSACGPTLMRTSKGWHSEDAAYYLKPAAGGGLIGSGWSLVSHEPKGDGYRSNGDLPQYQADLEFARVEDDGLLIAVTERIPGHSTGKLSGVLLDRWIERVVTNPGRGDYAMYAAVVPPIVVTSEHEVPMTIVKPTSTTVFGRNLAVTRREDFKVPGGTGTELVANLVPGDAQGPDRSLYVAVLKHAWRAEMLVVAYANSPNMFERGLQDAVDLAHRISFQ